MGSYPFVVAEQKVLFGAILAVGNNRLNLRVRRYLMPLDKGGHLVPFVDSAGRHLDGGNDLASCINGPVGLILQFCSASSLPHDGRIGIGSGDVSPIHHVVGAGLRDILLQSLLGASGTLH